MSDATAEANKPLEEQVLREHGSGVLRITLNRPEAQNAITPDQRDYLIALLADASADVATRVVVLTGTGKGFCTGADLRVSRTAPARPGGAPERVAGDVSRMLRDGAQRLVSAILDCEKPVITAVNGTAAGIGAHMAFASDLVIAADTARFIEVFVRRGLVPDGGGAYLLARLVGPQKAKELFFFGDALSAPDAHAMGLVNKVVAADDLEGAATAWAERLAVGPTRAISLTKWLVNRSLEADRAGALHDEALAQELNMGTHDAQEGVDSFVERRDAEFKGW
jgi:2-(1,2-epoxy-1,2-dihydrophenyl)acetyl-CoA isomerase